MERFSLLLAFICLLVGSQASAKSTNYVFTGADMYESCTHALNGLNKTGAYDDHRFGVCAGYVAGIVDFHTVVTTVEAIPDDMFCLPENITTAQVIRVVTKYLENNPEKHHDLAGYLVVLALRESYPCTEQMPKE